VTLKDASVVARSIAGEDRESVPQKATELHDPSPFVGDRAVLNRARVGRMIRAVQRQ
jgi:hypothetical protein